VLKLGLSVRLLTALKIDRRLGREMEGLTDRWASVQTDGKMHKHISRWADEQTYQQMGVKQTHQQMGRQMNSCSYWKVRLNIALIIYG
jgi:hypothetical protein